MRAPLLVWDEEEASIVRTNVKDPSISCACSAPWDCVRVGTVHSWILVPSATPSGSPVVTVTARRTVCPAPSDAVCAISERMMI